MDSYALVASARTRAARARQLPTAHCHAAQTRVYVDDASSLVAFRVGPSPGSEAIMKRRTTGRAWPVPAISGGYGVTTGFAAVLNWVLLRSNPW